MAGISVGFLRPVPDPIASQSSVGRAAVRLRWIQVRETQPAMDDAQRQRVDEVLAEAMKKPTEERADYVRDATTGDDAVRDEVLSLLEHIDHDDLLDSKLEIPASVVGGTETVVNPDPTARPGDALDDNTIIDEKYRILQFIGKGGFAYVYLAEELAPLRGRRVAIKVIRPGMQRDDIVARFDQERQTMAMMEHPGIARALDAGTMLSGLPYFVMEYVKGLTIVDYCDENKLDVRARLALFTDVCRAVHHAHQRGVLHRDLKPSNILVGEVDGAPRPKVIDFGVAKALNQRLTDFTVFTTIGAFIGTPQYMSPEQASSAAAELDTRADVYSLGVILYELLTGALPIPRELFIRKSVEEMQRVVREVSVEKPSTRILNEDTSRLRGTDSTHLERTLRQELDWIPLMALRKEKERRYDSALSLAHDIENYLSDRPIIARPDSRWYHLRKALKRYRLEATVAGIVLAALLIGGIGTGIGFVQKSEALEEKAIALDRTQLLLDMREAKALVDEADASWPIHPDSVPAMDAWLERAEALVAREDELSEEYFGTFGWLEPPLAWTPLDPALANRATFLTDYLNDLQDTYDIHNPEAGDIGIERNAVLDVEQPILQQYVDRLTFQAESLLIREPMFSEEEHQFSRLLANIRMLSHPDFGLIDEVRARRDAAAALHTVSLVDHAQRWDDAITSIRNDDECPLYQGLSIAPQLGLVPIGRDPQSGLWEFWHVASGAEPSRDANGVLQINGDTGIVLVLMPGGEFVMGAPAADDGNGFIKPVERYGKAIELAPYFLSKYELNQGQWLRIARAIPSERFFTMRPGSQPLPATRTHPVESITWHDAQRVMSLLDLELPTEAQWEFGARGGTMTLYWTNSDDPSSIHPYENFYDISAARSGVTTTELEPPTYDDGYLRHAPAEAGSPNPFGLYHVLGNVREWTRDPYCGGFAGGIKSMDQTTGAITPAYAMVWKSVRGGSFDNGTRDLRVTRRFNMLPSTGSKLIGVRPSRALDQAKTQ
ncbi:MAG: bifunctional serine/threonine-protein kinase/formylglycine-generating enzyme family protein [Planctomycetota bacterium]